MRPIRRSGRLFCFLRSTATDSATVESCRSIQSRWSTLTLARRLDRSVRRTESTRPDPDSRIAAELPHDSSRIAGHPSAVLDRLRTGLPDLRLLTPSDYDRAFLSNP